MLHTTKLISWLAGLLLVGTLFYTVSYFSGTLRSKSDAPFYTVDLLTAKAGGDNVVALAQYRAIQDDPRKTSEEKALAELLIVGAEFSQTGDVKARLREIQKMKEISMDASLSAGVRATAMAILGSEYSVSGNDPVVFAEIYKDPPFDSYLVPNDPHLSALNIEKASYAIVPTPVAAVKIAHIASGQYFANPNQSASTRAAHIAMTEEYINKADVAVMREIRGAGYTEGDRYMFYRALRAVSIGQLAAAKGQLEGGAYRKEFEDFFTLAQSKKSFAAKNSLLNVRYEYASILAADEDTAAEKAQLDLLARELNELPNPKIYTLVLLLRNEHTYRPTGPVWVATEKMFKVSPDLKAAVNKIIAS